MIPFLWILSICMDFALLVSGIPVKEYIIFPVDRSSIGQQAYVFEFLAFKIESLAGGPKNVYTEIRRGRRFPDFWTADLSKSAFQTLQSEPLVSISIRSHRSTIF